MVDRFGYRRVMTAGLVFVTLALVGIARMQPDWPLWIVLVVFFFFGFGMGNVIAPASTVMQNVLPLALGVAVIGSVLATTYGNQIRDFLTGLGLPLPQPMIDSAHNSIGAVQNGIVPRLQEMGLADAASRISAEANSAFVGAVHWGVLTAAAATAIGVVVVLLFLPARARVEDVADQDVEFVGEQVADLLND